MIYLTLLLPAIVAIGFLGFTRLTGARNQVDELLSEVNAHLGNRHDLIPPLVERAREYADEEPPVFNALGQIRTHCMSVGGLQEKADAETALTGHLKQFLSLAGCAPPLVQDCHFAENLERLRKTEKQIAQTIGEYNAAVRKYNAMLETGTTGMVSGLLSFRPESLFEVKLVTTGS